MAHSGFLLLSAVWQHLSELIDRVRHGRGSLAGGSPGASYAPSAPSVVLMTSHWSTHRASTLSAANCSNASCSPLMKRGWSRSLRCPNVVPGACIQAGRRPPTVTIPEVQSGLNPGQVVSLVEETETAIKLLDEGIRVIAEWDGGEDDRIRGLFSMSQGFERLLKLTMTLILYGEGAHPSSKDFKKQYGHRLLPLLDDVLAKARADVGLMQRAALRADIDFCASDKHLREMFDIFGEFGERGALPQPRCRIGQ